MHRPTRADFRSLLDLAVPLAAVQVGLMLMGVVDAAMLGRVSADALAAASVAGVWFFAASTIGMGCLTALDPVISQAFGAQDEVGVARGVQRGVLIAVIVTVPTMLVMLPIEAVLRFTKQPAAVVPLAGAYLRVILPSILPYFAFMMIREVLQSLGSLRTLLVIIGLANLLNVVLNWALIFGHLGAPALGVTGAALATTISRWAMLAMTVVATWRFLKPYVVPWRPESWALAPLGRMFAIGLPIGFQILFEYGVFGGVGLLMGQIGSQAVAGHQVALNMAAITFMVPFGIGTAASVLVGGAVGGGRPDEARRLTSAALVVGVAFMTATATIFRAFPEALARAYSPDPAVLGVAAGLVPLAGLFQVFDGTQVVAMGVLRGIGDTRIPVLVNLAGYYLVGLPISLWLGFELGWGPRGLWWGLVAGLVVVALALVGRVRLKFRRNLDRLTIDRPEHSG